MLQEKDVSLVSSDLHTDYLSDLLSNLSETFDDRPLTKIDRLSLALSFLWNILYF